MAMQFLDGCTDKAKICLLYHIKNHDEKKSLKLDLLDGCKVKGEWDFTLPVASLIFIPDDKIPFVMEDQKV